MGEIASTTVAPGSVGASFLRYRAGEWQRVQGAVVLETPVTVFVNRRELVTINCTPVKVNHLVIGFLANEGLIESLEDVLMMRVCDEEATVDVRLKHEPPQDIWQHRTLTSGCAGGHSISAQAEGLPRLSSPLAVAPEQLLDLMRQLLATGTLFRHSGGVHTSGLADERQVLVVAEDVGRHNTIDKIRGQCLLEDRATRGRILLATGRLSSDMVAKAARMGTPVVASRNSPTSRAVTLGEELGITLVGYVRADGFTVYSHSERIQPGAPEGAPEGD